MLDQETDSLSKPPEKLLMKLCVCAFMCDCNNLTVLVHTKNDDYKRICLTMLSSFNFRARKSEISPLIRMRAALVCAWMYLSSAVGEPGRRWSGAGRRHQRGAERAPGSDQRLLVSGLAPPKPRPDEGQRYKRDHEHRETLHQTPQGHLWGTKHLHAFRNHTSAYTAAHGFAAVPQIRAGQVINCMARK